jgi:ribonucleoside-diphosphate reductase alpha chain
MIEIKAQIELHDGMTTKTIDELLLKAMVDLIDETENPEINNVNYQQVAGRQKVSMLRKEVYGEYEPPALYDIVKKNVEMGMYTSELLEWYTKEEWDIIDLFIDHAKDENYTYAAVAQLAEKYLVQNRATGQIYETPQVRYAIAAATERAEREAEEAATAAAKEAAHEKLAALGLSADEIAAL